MATHFDQFNRSRCSLQSHHQGRTRLQPDFVRILERLSAVRHAAAGKLLDVRSVTIVQPKQRLRLIPLSGCGTEYAKQGSTVKGGNAPRSHFDVHGNAGQTQVGAVFGETSERVENPDS